MWDGRANHNNGWYIVRGVIPAEKTTAALEWIVTPHVVKKWVYEPVIQVSQVGYGLQQPKKVVIEQDKRDTKASDITIFKLSETGKTPVKKAKVEPWGNFLRYQYMTYDFSSITEPGMYQISYRVMRGSLR